MSPLRIGINALFLIPGAVGGTEIVLRSLLRAMERAPRGHQYFIFVNRETGLNLAPVHPNFHTIQTGINATSRPARLIYEQVSLPGDARAAKIDVMFCPGFTSPHFFECPKVPLIHDLQHHHHPEFFKASHLLAWRLFVWASAKWATRILTVSDASRQDIHAIYGVPLERIHVAEPGVEPELFSFDRTAEEPLVLCVSTLHLHKNQERLIDAFAAFRVRHPEYRLVLAGLFGSNRDGVEQRIRRHGLQKSVTLTGWISRDQLLALYAKARIAVFPSLFEGFGMPVVEAMAAGVPLIASDVAPMKDVIAGTALLFPPTDTTALANALERFASDPALRAQYAARARERARLFTWDRGAAITLDALELAVRGGHPHSPPRSANA